MLSALIPSARGYPAARLASRPANQRRVRHGPLVLVPAPLKPPTPATDRDRTVSRRSEPSSRATLIGEQPNPWDLLQPQLLSFERWPFHAGTTGSLCPAFAPARLVGLAVKRPSAIALGRRLPIALRAPWEASVTLLEATTPVKLPATRCPPKKGVRSQTREGPYFNAGSPSPGEGGSMPPAYPTRPVPGNNAKLQ